MDIPAFPFLVVPRRPPKPRTNALTIGTDQGWPLHTQEDWLESHHDLIDWAKCADHYGLAGRYPEAWMRKKVALYHRYQIPVFIGGVTFELAYLQSKAEMLFHRMKELGLDGVEISEDVVPDMPPAQRKAFIRLAIDLGLQVFTEVGKKFGDTPFTADEAVNAITFDLEAGAYKVTLEAAEIQALFRTSPQTLVAIAQKVGLEPIVFELKPAPWPDMALWLFRTFGPSINVENISVEEALLVERMRFGMCREVGYTFLREQKGQI